MYLTEILYVFPFGGIFEIKFSLFTFFGFWKIVVAFYAYLTSFNFWCGYTNVLNLYSFISFIHSLMEEL